MMKTNLRKAIIPVGGLGTRFLPATKSVPKELFPLLHKPVIQYLAEELSAAGITDITFVISESKENIKKHFSPDTQLENVLQDRGKEALHELVVETSRLGSISFVVQKEPLGDGHAILCAEKLIGDEPCIVIFGDTLVDTNPSLVEQLVQTYKKTHKPVVAVMPIDINESSNYGMVSLKNDYTVAEIDTLVEKPDPKNAPSNLAIIGAYVITPDVFLALHTEPTGVGGEIRLIDALHMLLKQGGVSACKIRGEWLDTGTVFGLIKANIHMGLKDPIVGPLLKRYLRGLDF